MVAIASEVTSYWLENDITRASATRIRRMSPKNHEYASCVCMQLPVAVSSATAVRKRLSVVLPIVPPLCMGLPVAAASATPVCMRLPVALPFVTPARRKEIKSRFLVGRAIQSEKMGKLGDIFAGTFIHLL